MFLTARLSAVASEDAYIWGFFQPRSRHLGIGCRWQAWRDRPASTNNSRCFEPFPFPAATDAQQARIRGLAEQLDAHRKRQQAQHPKLTLTDMYNVLEKLRAGEPLTAKDKTVHEQGLVSVLREIHDELDAAVCDAYGWPVTLTDEEILARLVALNAERAAEEAQGLIRWLRPGVPGARRSRFTLHAARPDPGRLPHLRSLPRNTPPPSLAHPHGRAGPGRARRAGCAGRAGVRRSSRRRVRRRASRSASPSCWRRWSRWGRREGLRMDTPQGSRTIQIPQSRTLDTSRAGMVQYAQ